MIRSLAIVLVVGVVIAIAIVLPAEYGRDPTGVGRMLGLREMGEIKAALAAEAAAHAAADSAMPGTLARPGAGAMFDSTSVIVPPGQTRTLMLEMAGDARVDYRWSAAGGMVNHDLHGVSPTVGYRSYAKGTGVKSDSGVLLAAFNGQHGWTWRNGAADSIVVSLRVIGQYDELKRRP